MNKTCSNCILDGGDDPDISIDANGFCNHCRKYYDDEARLTLKGEKGAAEWERLVSAMKKDGLKKKYDCILGLSGGVDSSFLALEAKKKELKVLCVHMDNGWNSKEATRNIRYIVERLKFDLHTVVVNWDEMRDVQRAYLKAGVLDLDVPADHAIAAVVIKLAMKFQTRYIISGFNVATESILPANFNYDKGDATNLTDIHRRFGEKPIGNFPLFGQRLKILAKYFYKIQTVTPLNYLDYNREKAIEILQRELGWEPYGQKHFENLFTRFYQGYILPERFHLDKRKAHLSNLICSGAMTRSQALEEIKKPVYDSATLRADKKYFLSKLGFSEDEFEEMMRQPIRSHTEFKSEKPLSKFVPGVKILKKMVGH